MQIKARQLLVAALVLGCAASAPAEIVRIGLTAEITYVDPYSQWLDENFKLGDIITGSYTYDTSAPDTNPSPNVGDYRYNSPPFGVSLNCNGFTFETDPQNVNFLLEVGDNHVYSSWDHYLIYSYSNRPLSNDIRISLISWNLDDASGTALASDALPVVPPPLDKWDHDWGVRVYFGPKGGSSISADVSSVYVIPEPSCILLFASGALSLLRRRTV
jgi:hypothetical protein